MRANAQLRMVPACLRDEEQHHAARLRQKKKDTREVVARRARKRPAVRPEKTRGGEGAKHEPLLRQPGLQARGGRTDFAAIIVRQEAVGKPHDLLAEGILAYASNPTAIVTLALHIGGVLALGQRAAVEACRRWSALLVLGILR